MTRATDGDDIAKNAGQSADQFASKHESQLQLLLSVERAQVREDCPLPGKIYPTVCVCHSALCTAAEPGTGTACYRVCLHDSCLIGSSGYSFHQQHQRRQHHKNILLRRFPCFAHRLFFQVSLPIVQLSAYAKCCQNFVPSAELQFQLQVRQSNMRHEKEYATICSILLPFEHCGS